MGAGWLLTHGSTQSPRGDEILGLGATQFTALLAVPAALWAVSLGALPVIGDSRGLTGRRVGRLLAQLGALAVALGAGRIASNYRGPLFELHRSEASHQD